MGGRNDANDNAFLATKGVARVGESATTRTTAGGGFGGGGNVFNITKEAEPKPPSDQQSSKRKMQISTHQQQRQRRQHAVDKKNVGSSSSLPVSNGGGDSQTARAVRPRMTPLGPTMMESQAFHRPHSERFGEEHVMMESPPPPLTAYAGVSAFDAAALAALESKEEEKMSIDAELVFKSAQSTNDEMKHSDKLDILLEEDSKTVIDLEGAADILGEKFLDGPTEVIDLTTGEEEVAAEMNRLGVLSNTEGETSSRPLAAGEDAVAVLTAACEKLPERFTESVTKWLDEECPGTKPLFLLENHSCATTIFKYDLSDRDKPAELEKATTDVLNRIKSECREGVAVVQKIVHLAFATAAAAVAKAVAETETTATTTAAERVSTTGVIFTEERSNIEQRFRMER